MLFNSPEFIFLFLPCAVVLHFVLARWSIDAALTGTAMSSLFFYTWWNPPFVALPLASIAFNFWFARTIAAHPAAARQVFILGIAANLLALGHFKYSGFVVSIVQGSTVPLPNVPLALSFTTFVQIAFLAEVYKRRRAPDLRSYSVFVLFFPHLIAGPIVRWSSLGRQLRDPVRYRLDWDNVALGLTIFTFGLAKKMLIADSLAPHIAVVFDAASHGEHVMGAAAWAAAFGYLAEIYFDFSGYSDMAVGLGLLFNFRLPINFAAPLRSCSLFDLWRRWHITLSRFMRDFIYVPLGFGRPGPLRRATNLMITMLLAGLWHGANWTFIAWGAFNGVALLINFAWRTLRGPGRPSRVARLCGWAATLTTFAVSTVFFRATDIQASWRMLKAMAGFGDAQPRDQVILPWDEWGIRMGYVSEDIVRTWFGSTWSMVGTAWVVGALAVALLVPDTMEITNYREGDAQSDWRRKVWSGVWTWQPTPAWLALQLVLFVAVFHVMGRVGEFLYYQF